LYLDQIIKDFIKGIKNGSIQIKRSKKRYSIGSIKVYETLEDNFKSVQDHYKSRWTIEDVTNELATKWTAYLHKEKMSDSTIGKYHKHFKRVINVSLRNIENENYNRERKGFKPILSDRSIRRIQIGLENFIKLESESSDIYLTNEEIKTLYHLEDLEPHLEKANDIFLCGVYSGLRYSDFHRLGPEHIKNGNIEIINEKTKHRVRIPIRPELNQILKKYNHQLPNMSSQKLNVYIKEVCKIAEIDEPIEVSKSKGGLTKISKSPKYKLVKTKTARKSFACNLHLEGTFSLIDIMTMTGHKNIKSFETYINPVINDTNKRVKDSVFFKGDILKVV